MKTLKYLIFLGFSTCLFSCASLNQSLNFEEDDIYYSNDFQHRLNEQALLMNKNVAMPDSAITYFDETYAESIRPSYQKQLNKFNDSETSNSYIDDADELNEYYYQNVNEQNNRWMSTVSLGLVAGGYGYNNAYYGYNSNPYYSSYNATPSYFHSGYNNYYSRPAPRVNTTPTYVPYEPFSSYGSNRSNRAANTNSTQNRNVYTNPNPGYQRTSPGVNTNRQYKTRTTIPNNGSNSGGYNSGTRSGGSYSGGSVGGHRRR